MGSRMTREQLDSSQQSKKRFDAPFCALSVRRSPSSGLIKLVRRASAGKLSSRRRDSSYRWRQVDGANTRDPLRPRQFFAEEDQMTLPVVFAEACFLLL